MFPRDATELVFTKELLEVGQRKRIVKDSFSRVSIAFERLAHRRVMPPSAPGFLCTWNSGQAVLWHLGAWSLSPRTTPLAPQSGRALGFQGGALGVLFARSQMET